VRVLVVEALRRLPVSIPQLVQLRDQHNAAGPATSIVNERRSVESSDSITVGA
jgi:hypothetical protein